MFPVDPLVGVVVVVVCVMVIAVYLNREWRQDAPPTDRPAIDDFASRHGLRIISVTRSTNVYMFLFWSGTRTYDIAVEDSDGRRGTIQVGFHSLRRPGRLVMLEQQGGIPFIRS
jgi:hypothetical protein